MEYSEISTRFQLTIAMLLSVLIIAGVVMALAAFDKPVPDFISGVVLAGFMLMLKDAYTSYFKAREEMIVKPDAYEIQREVKTAIAEAVG